MATIADKADILHEIPSRPMSAYEMHCEYRLHRDCLICARKEWIREALHRLGHNPDHVSACPACLSNDGGRHDYLNPASPK